MSEGQCLCGRVTWDVDGGVKTAYHCHCKMCRKLHGAAFATYWVVEPGGFRWTSTLDSVVTYPSSPALTRAFCGTCGSVVPSPDGDSAAMYVPAGCHDDGEPAACHIFAAHKAPWYEISDDLPRHDDFPPGDDSPVIEEKPLPDAPPGAVRGGCLCGAVEFHVLEPFAAVYNCHCRRCRRARAAAHTTNGFTALDGVRLVKGEEHVKTYRLPEARYFAQAFCDVCGSGLPRLDPGREIAVVPLGALDDDPGVKPMDNIFVASKAGWYPISDDLPAHDEDPPARAASTGRD